MTCGVADSGAGAGDFRFQCGDAFLQLLDRKGIEILPHEIGQGIGFGSWRKLVQVHIRSVDRDANDVNKEPRGFATIGGS